MGYATNHQGNAQLANYIPEKWGTRVNEDFRSKLVFGNHFTDRSEELMGGGDILHTPNLAFGTANAKGFESAVTFNQQTESVVDLTVDQWFETSFLIEDKALAQVQDTYRIEERYMEMSAYVSAKKLESAIGALFSAFTQSNGDSSTALQDSNILDAIATLEGNDVNDMGDDMDPQRKVAFFMHPTVFWKQGQAIDKFSLAQNSPVNDPTAKRPRHSLYGFPVYVSSNVPVVLGAYQNVLAHEDAIHWATGNLPVQMAGQRKGEFGVRLTSAYTPEYLGIQITADILYGVVENRDNAGFLLKTSS